jgi:7,8-dihydropterin-6-yl-methyl-4-(beta-D-ribofuranosyl)aminobenzene 5'-phosphate synthase
MKRRTFIKALLVGSGSLIFGSHDLIASVPDKNMIKILMLYNNVGNAGNLVSRWGVAIWIEDKDTAVLFDTGGNPSTLWDNMVNAGIDLEKLSKIVISHNHWDHVNGIPIVLERTNYKVDVLVPDSDFIFLETKNPRARLIGIKKPVQINDFLWSTGQLKGSTWSGIIHEQSLAIVQNGSIYLMTGCSHPGLDQIVERVKQYHHNKKIDLIIGGFHLMRQSNQQVRELSSKLKSLQVKKLAPSHCSGEQATNIFREEWREDFIDFNIGNSMKI